MQEKHVPREHLASNSFIFFDAFGKGSDILKFRVGEYKLVCQTANVFAWQPFNTFHVSGSPAVYELGWRRWICPWMAPVGGK